MTEPWPANLTVRSMTAADAQRIRDWRYDGPWTVYDSRPDDDPMSDNLAVAGTEGGPLVGFCCSGVEATVPGLPPDDTVLDIGVGMDPAFVGQGHGPAFATAVLDHYRSTTGMTRFRVVVQAWNERSLRLTRSLGFTDAGDHVVVQNGQPVTYRILVRGV